MRSFPHKAPTASPPPDEATHVRGAGLAVGRTERGFAIVKFTDLYDSKCSLQKSSLALQDCVWLGTDTPGHDRMHLTREMVEALLPLLLRFVATGELEP
jgi:hypothetical protein